MIVAFLGYLHLSFNIVPNNVIAEGIRHTLELQNKSKIHNSR